ncbi:hypothetical protein [uncultured Desulfovibrio sp.]|uniref:hypothetical protein n=1 Tax=uncultured Desulfovibrio sp. TaxID=167968 RepID=UPI0026727960|nr:hypothetical protein [uncultured Desulfovibrio sp.]
MNIHLPALPGGVGIFSDVLADISKRLSESGDILADYRAVLASARRNGVSIPKETRKEARAAMRPIERMRALARLQLYLTLLNAGYGRVHHELS